MTDYIADLLREQEEREERRAERDWRKAWEETALPIAEPEEAAGVGGTAAGTAESGSAAEERQAGEAAETDAAAALRLLTEGASGGSIPIPEGMVGANSIPSGAEWMDEALRQSLTELPAPRRESRVVTLQKPGEKIRPGGWDAAGLDRLVRRDARRFDGGFQLL